jgi:hypothetical protein
MIVTDNCRLWCLALLVGKISVPLYGQKSMQEAVEDIFECVVLKLKETRLVRCLAFHPASKDILKNS